MTQHTALTAKLKAVLASPRLSAVAAQSFSSGLPLGLVTVSIPAWMAMTGADIRTVGIVTAAQAPYAFKFLWSPLVERLSFPILGGKRGWTLAAQLTMALLTGVLALQADAPSPGAVIVLAFALAFASATQDIAVDAYAVETLEKEEQGAAVGLRTAVYRAAMWIGGSIAISLSGVCLLSPERPLGWGWTLGIMALLFLLMTPSAFLAPAPAHPPPRPQSFAESVVAPFAGFLAKPRALEIVAFLLLYKLADNLAVSLVRPFLVQTGFSPFVVGVASGTVGLAATLAGTFLGGLLTGRMGVGRALWVFGILQACGNAGYAAVAASGPDALLLYAATILDSGTSGLGTGAFMVLLLRLTSKRFSATQYALFSSMFALGRTLCGPLASILASAFGWRDFFLLSMVFSLPGLVLLHRFVPWGTRELPAGLEGGGDEASDAASDAGLWRDIPWKKLARPSVCGFALAFAASAAVLAFLDALKAWDAGAPFQASVWLRGFLCPDSLGGIQPLLGAVCVGLGAALARAAAGIRALRKGQAAVGPSVTSRFRSAFRRERKRERT